MKRVPRQAIWIEDKDSRCMGTGVGPFTVYEGEFVMVVAGKTLEDCERMFSKLIRTRGEFKPDE